MKSQPLVSAIITTKNSEKTLPALLKSLKSQSYRNLEIVLVDNHSSDETLEVARKFTDKVFQKGPERSVQRNYGASVSKGAYLLFLDSDMQLTKDVMKACIEKVVKEPLVAGVVIPERSFGMGFWAKAKILERKINEGEHYFEAARFFLKKAFVAAKGFDESLTGPEDWDLPQTIARKYEIARIKPYILHNEGNPNLFGLARRKYYYGLSVHRYLKKQGIPVLSPKTVYFLRPSFYKNLGFLTRDPLVSLGMIIMLLAETIGGGLGYIMGRINND